MRAVYGFGFAAAVAAGWVALVFNRFIRRRNLMREAWSGVDVQLKRRHDLVPRLVDCVKGYRAHEAGVLERVASARAQAQSAQDFAATGAAENDLARGLRGLLAVAEAYPDLKASESFRGLSGALIEIEDQLQYARRYYNGAVRDYNILVEAFPSQLFARLFGFHAEPFFQIESSIEGQAPEVSL